MRAPTPGLWCGLVYAASGDERELAMYRAVSRNIEVTVTPRFLPERSSPENGYFFWAYTIAIANHGTETVQLLTRHWQITDAFGRLQEVRGAGVVGEQPVLAPGETFEYTSGVPLQTPSGFMVGSYGMVSETGERFDIAIPAFSLDRTDAKRVIN
jgi:ApaG protein